MFVELSLGSAKSNVEVIVIKGGVDDLVAVILQVGRFDATGDRVPAVEEEDFYGDVSLKAPCESPLA